MCYHFILRGEAMPKCAQKWVFTGNSPGIPAKINANQKRKEEAYAYF